MEQNITKTNEQINSYYDRIRKRIIGTSIGLIVSGSLIAFTGSHYFIKEELSFEKYHYKNTPIIEMKHKAENTLQILYKKKVELGSITPLSDISYLPDEVKEEANNLFGESERKISSLDRIIKKIEEDLSKMKQSDEFKAYEIERTKISNRDFYSLTIGLLIAVSSIPYMLLRAFQIEGKRSKELDALNKDQKKIHRIA